MLETLDPVLDLWRDRIPFPLCVAGGAVRDTLLGRTPKDVDVFVFGVRGVDEEVFHGLTLVECPEWHKSEPFLQATVDVAGVHHQVMAVPDVDDMEDLVDGFDWNVSRFAYDGTAAFLPVSVDDVAEGRDLKLHRVTYPRSTLRRGFRYSERFGMRFRSEDVDRLCWMVLEPGSKEEKK